MLIIDFKTMNDEDIYNIFVTEGNEAESLNGVYPELVEIIGYKATLKLFKYFRGYKIDCPKFYYKQDYIVECAKIAIASGYTTNRLEVLVNQWKKRNKKSLEKGNNLHK